jgi:Uma2 family endonuclease
MSVAVTELPRIADPPRKRWTRAEFDALASSGVLQDQRLELVGGELISKMGKKQPHVVLSAALADCCRAIFGLRFVFQESPIDVAPEDNPTNEPEPDVIVLGRDRSEFSEAKPRPQDLRLVAEVSETTLYFDLTTKAALYARAGIVDYWVLDVTSRRMIVHRDPRDGKYHSVLAYGLEEMVAPLAAPESAIRIADLFS